VTIEQLNALPSPLAEEQFRTCCGSSRWTAAMVASRPFEDLDGLLCAAERIWWTTGPEDWDEAMAAHPRIGQTAARAQVSDAARGWSVQEQEAIAASDQAARRELAAAVDQYERKFGWIYLVSASGRSAHDLLPDLRARLENEPERERTVAAREESLITQLRLRKLIAE
jgi:2-oxo-4-hydroxy-4-carboxy-5-ureidoimidazoline decarboxylase